MISQESIKKQLADMDVDGDGNVDDAELEEFAKKFIKEKKSGAQKKTYLYWALAGLAVLAISNIGTAFLAFSAAKDLKVVGGWSSQS